MPTGKIIWEGNNVNMVEIQVLFRIDHEET